MNVENIKKILIISVSGLGITIMFMPLLDLIRKKFPTTEISILVGSKSVKDLLKGNENVGKIYVWDFLGKSKISTIKYLLSIRKESFDLSITVFPNLRKEHNLISFLIGAKTRLSHTIPGKKNKNFSFLNNKTIPTNLELHDIKNNLNLIKLIGIDDSDFQNPRLVLSDREIRFAEEYFQKHDVRNSDIVIGFHVAEHPTTRGRNWPAKKYADLFNILIKKNMKIIVFSTPVERPIVNEVINDTNNGIIVFENPEILKAASIIKRCNCFVTDDSGLMHVSSCVDTPIVAIFGPTNKKWTKPLSNNYKIIETGIECSPCFNRVEPPKGKDKNKMNLINCYIEDKFACTKYIEEETVLNAIKDLIKK